jgi:hypothetical protein
MHCRDAFHHIVGTSSEVCDVIRRLGAQAAVDVDNLLQRESLDVIGRVGFGKEFGAVQVPTST